MLMSESITSQPSAGGTGDTLRNGEWQTGVCSCCSDSLICFLGCILCPFCGMNCYTADKYGEPCWLGCVPGGMTALRTHMRMAYGIQGSL